MAKRAAYHSTATHRRTKTAQKLKDRQRNSGVTGASNTQATAKGGPLGPSPRVRVRAQTAYRARAKTSKEAAGLRAILPSVVFVSGNICQPQAVEILIGTARARAAKGCRRKTQNKHTKLCVAHKTTKRLLIQTLRCPFAFLAKVTHTDTTLFIRFPRALKCGWKGVGGGGIPDAF